MIAIIIQSLKTIFKFIDFEKKIDYFSILFFNLCILIVIFTIPFYEDYVLLSNFTNKSVLLFFVIITFGFLLVFFLVCVLLIKELMNFFIAFIEKGNRIYIKRSFNRKYYDDMIKLDSITDIENQFYGNVIDYFLGDLYKGIRYKYYNQEGYKYEEVAVIINKLFYKRLIFSRKHIKKKILLLIMTILTIVITILMHARLEINFVSSMIIVIIHDIYYFFSIGICSMIIKTIVKENTKAKLLILRCLKNNINKTSHKS